MWIASAGELLGLNIALLSLWPIFIAVRLYARRKQKASYALDDWMMLPTAVRPTVHITVYEVFQTDTVILCF